MIHTVWPYLAVMLLVAGLFPAVERRFGWQVFSVLPPIVLTYLLVTALAVSGLWQVNAEIQAAQSMLVSRLVPALLFLLMINCDLRAIWRLGPRVLGVFACTSISLFVAFIGTFLIYRALAARRRLAAAGRALSGSWVGGTANMIAVKQAIGMSDTHLAMSLLTDALCYSMWVVVLFSVARLAPAFNRWTRATSSGDIRWWPSHDRARRPPTTACCCGWAWRWRWRRCRAGWRSWLPVSSMISATTWTILLATGLGLVVAHTPLARFPGAGTISSAMLISVVAVLASQSNFQGIAAAPLYLLCGVTIIAIHAVLLVGFAKLFRFDLYLCGISSLAHIGGVAATPILAASYSRALVPVGVLLALARLHPRHRLRPAGGHRAVGAGGP